MISFSGVVYFSYVNNCSILVCVDLSVYRTASAGGGSDKKRCSMHVTQMLLQSKGCGCEVWGVLWCKGCVHINSI